MSGCTCEPGTNVPQPHPPWDCQMGPSGWEEDVEQEEHLASLIADEEEREFREEQRRDDELMARMDMAGYDPMGLDGGDR